MPRTLADVFLPGGVNRRILTTPGRAIQFFGGRCQVVDGRDMPHVFAMPDARVFPLADAMPWAPEWLARTREIKAEVNWPEGWAVEHINQDEWHVEGPDDQGTPATLVAVPGAVATVTTPVETEDITDRQWDPGLRPEVLVDILQEPEESPIEESGKSEGEGGGVAVTKKAHAGSNRAKPDPESR